MKSSKFRFTLDLHKTQSQISIPVTQGDTARTWLISFSDGSLPYTIGEGCLAKLEIKRPTGTHIEEFCAIENGTTVRYSFSQNKNTAAVEGIHECAIVLYDAEGTRLASPRFTMIVSIRVINSDDINISDDDKTAIEAILEAEVVRQNAETERITAEASRIEAEEARITSESARSETESARITAENDRKKGEADRITAEDERHKTFKEIAEKLAAIATVIPGVTADDNGKVIGVVDGKYALVKSLEYDYDVEIKNIISFMIDFVIYRAEKGMTWDDWVDSEYNTDGFFAYDEYVEKGGKNVDLNGTFVIYTDQILHDALYGLVAGSNGVSFTIGGKEYFFDGNMTWKEWCESPYNTDGFRIGFYDYVLDGSLNGVVSEDGSVPATATDLIEAGHKYNIHNG